MTSGVCHAMSEELELSAAGGDVEFEDDGESKYMWNGLKCSMLIFVFV